MFPERGLDYFQSIRGTDAISIILRNSCTFCVEILRTSISQMLTKFEFSRAAFSLRLIHLKIIKHHFCKDEKCGRNKYNKVKRTTEYSYLVSMTYGFRVVVHAKKIEVLLFNLLLESTLMDIKLIIIISIHTLCIDLHVFSGV